MQTLTLVLPFLGSSQSAGAGLKIFQNKNLEINEKKKIEVIPRQCHKKETSQLTLHYTTFFIYKQNNNYVR